jgi:hypothetical protein
VTTSLHPERQRTKRAVSSYSSSTCNIWPLNGNILICESSSQCFGCQQKSCGGLDISASDCLSQVTCRFSSTACSWAQPCTDTFLSSPAACISSQLPQCLEMLYVLGPTKTVTEPQCWPTDTLISHIATSASSTGSPPGNTASPTPDRSAKPYMVTGNVHR